MKKQIKVNRKFGIVFTLLLLMTPNITKAAILPIKGLYEIFTPDVIGIGQALLTNGWIENVYTYAPDDNLAKKVIKSFWHKNRDRVTGNINEMDAFLATEYDPIKGILASDLGKILKYIGDFKGGDKIEANRKALVASLSNKVKKNSKKSGFIIDILKAIEALRVSEDFIPETAEAILWAFFDDKFKKKEDLDACLKELGKSIGEELYLENDYKIFDSNVKNISLGNSSEKIINEYDIATYSLIKKAREKIIPPQVVQIKTAYKFNGKETKQFSTCFESAILDIISILFYDPKNKVYRLSMVPLVSESDFFKKVLKEVFFTSDGKFISPQNINYKVLPWINLIENRPWVNYSNSESIDNNIVRYDLNTTFENLIKIMYQFYSIGFDIKHDVEVIKVISDKLEINIERVIKEPRDAKDFWNEIFSYISRKFSTSNRKITFSVKSLDKNDKFAVIKDKVIISGSCGKINVKIEYLNNDYKEFNTSFDININSGHAYINSYSRDSNSLDFYRRIFEKFIYESTEKKALPLSILLINRNDLFSYKIKNKNILLYSQLLKRPEVKLDVIDYIFGNLFDINSKKLLNNLVDMIGNDFYFISSIVYSMRSKKIDNELFEKLINKNSLAVLDFICKEGIFNENLEGFAIKALDNKEIEVSSLDEYGFTVLHYATGKNDNIVEKILKHNKLKDFDKIIYFIRTNKDKEAIEIIKKKDVDINGPAGIDICNTPLYEAIKNGKKNIVKEILGNITVDINKGPKILRNSWSEYFSSYSPINVAVEYGDEDIVRLLLYHKDKNGLYDIDLNGIYEDSYSSDEIKSLVDEGRDEIEKQKVGKI